MWPTLWPTKVGKTSETLFSVSVKKLNDAFNHGDIVI